MKVTDLRTLVVLILFLDDKRRQWVALVRALALRLGDPRLKTREAFLLNLILVVPGSSPIAQLGFLKVVVLALKSPQWGSLLLVFKYQNKKCKRVNM